MHEQKTPCSSAQKKVRQIKMYLFLTLMLFMVLVLPAWASVWIENHGYNTTTGSVYGTVATNTYGDNSVQNSVYVGLYVTNSASPALTDSLAWQSVDGSVYKANYTKAWRTQSVNMEVYDTVKTTVVSGVYSATVPSNNANLSDLTLNAGTWNSVFNADTTSYTINVVNSVAQTTVTATYAEPHATIKVNGTGVTSGLASAPITLNVGANTVAVAVYAQDNTTTKTYTVTVNRASSGAALSSNADLSALTLSEGTLNPVFNANTTSYTIAVANSVAQTTLTATYAEPHATIKLNGNIMTSGLASAPIALNVGANTVAVVVCAQDNTTTKTYTVTVNRASVGAAHSSNANLSTLSLSAGSLVPAFDASRTSYIVSVYNSVSTATVTATAAEAHAAIKVNGVSVAGGVASAPITLNEGSNSVAVAVYAQDGATVKTYTVTVVRASPPVTISGSGTTLTAPQQVSIPLPGGGTVTLTLPAGIAIPAGANIEVGVISTEMEFPIGLGVGQVVNVHFNFDINALLGATTSIQLTLSCKDAHGRVYWYNPTTSQWVFHGGIYDPVTGLITVNVTHFSVYGVFTDSVAPAVSSTDPQSGATAVAIDKTVTVTFSEPVAQGSNFSSIALMTGNTAVAYTASISNNVLSIQPSNNLSNSTAYTVMIPAGAVNDLSGNALAQASPFSFTTASSGGGSSFAISTTLLDDTTVSQPYTVAITTNSYATAPYTFSISSAVLCRMD